MELGEEKRQTTQRWVETATATEKSTNTIVKNRQKHSFLINTGNNRLMMMMMMMINFISV